MNTSKQKEQEIKENIEKSFEYLNNKRLQAKFDRTRKILRNTPENAGKLIDARNRFNK